RCRAPRRAGAVGERRNRRSDAESQAARIARIAAGNTTHGHDSPLSGGADAGRDRKDARYAGPNGEESFAEVVGNAAGENRTQHGGNTVMEDLEQQLRNALARKDAPEWFEARVMAAVRREGEVPSRRQAWRTILRWRFVTALMA